MSLSDEEPIVPTPYDSGTKHETLRRGNIKVTTINKEETGLDDSHLSVFFEVTGAGYKSERPGVDIVTVLDVGDSMKGEKLETLKNVMRLLIDKLSSADRLSIVTVSKDPQKLCGLRQMGLISQAEIEKLVSGLETRPGKEVNGGLDMAYKVINDRKYATGRRAAILLMSDGQFQVPVKHIFIEAMPVYTFGIGGDVNSMVLNDVAKHSDGGIHCSIDVRSSSPSNLRSAVAECFSKLFTVVVSDLKLTVRRAKSTAMIDNICVGTYSRSDIQFTALDDNVIVFGDLYANETCKVKVDLHLSRVTTQQPCDLLHFSYSWRTMGEDFTSSSRLVRVTRVANLIEEGDTEEEKDEIGPRVLDLGKIQRLFKRIFVSLVNLFWLLVSFVERSIQSIFRSLSFDKHNKSRAKGSNEEIESETSNKLISISSCIYKFSILPLLGFLSLVSKRTEDMWNRFTNVLITIRESMNSGPGNNGVPAMKNDPSRAMSFKGFGSQIIGVSFRIFKYLTALLIVFLILYGMSKQIGRKSPIKPVYEQRDVPPVVNNNEIQSPVTDLMVYYCNSHVGILSDHLKKALDSVTILREISNYVKQQIRFQAHEGQSSDLLFRSKNVKALGEHIRLTFEWSKAIKKVLYNAESIRLCEKISDIRNFNDKPINDKPEEDESNNRKYWVCLLLLLASLVGIRLNKFSVRSIQDYLTNVSTRIQAMFKSDTPIVITDKPLEVKPRDVKHDDCEEKMKIMTDRIKQAFDSVKVIRGILNDYVKQHTEFEANSKNSKDSVRSDNVKALGDHIRNVIYSVEAFEDILKQSTPSTFLTGPSVEV